MQTAFYPCNTSAINKNTHDTNKIKKCMSYKVINTVNKTSRVITSSAKTMDETVQVPIELCDVGCNTMREKATNTNQLLFHSSERFRNKPYAAVEYDDIHRLVCSTTTIRSTNSCQTKIKN